MGSLRRIDRKLNVEELEPRIAPAPLVLAGNALKKFTFTDADGDRILITLSGSKASRVEISDQFGNTPGTAVGSEISLIEFTQANRKTALTIAFASGNTGPRTMPTPVDISASGLTLGSFVSPGSVNTLAADEIRLLNVSGDITGTVSLDLFDKGETIKARDITATGGVDVTNWLGGALTLSRNLNGFVNGANAIPGQISIGGDVGPTAQIQATGVVASLSVRGSVAAGAMFSSFTGFGPITVNGAGGFMGTILAQGPYGITSLTTTGPLGGVVDSSFGPIRSLAVGGDILGTAYVSALGTMNTLRVSGNVLGASIINVDGDINSVMIMGATGLEGSITATGAMGPVRITSGGILPNPIFMPNLAAGNGFTSTGITMPGDMNGAISAGAGTISSVTIGGSFGTSGVIENARGAIGNVYVNGASFGGAITAGTNITNVRLTRASLQTGSSIVAGGSIGRIDVLSTAGDLQTGAGITAGAVSTAGTGLGYLNLGRHLAGGVEIFGARGVTGGVRIGGNLTGGIRSTGPIAAAVTIGGNLTTSGYLIGGSAGTAINAPLTIGGNMDGTLGVAGGAKSGAITIQGNVGPTGVVRSIGNFTRDLRVNGNFLGVLQAVNNIGTIALTEGAGHGSVATAQPVSLYPSGTAAGGFITMNEVEPNDWYTPTPTIVPSIPVMVIGSITTETDEDWFRLTVTAGQSLTFDLDAIFLDPVNNKLRSQMILYDVNIAGLYTATGTTAGDPQFTYYFTTTGTYYLRLRSLNWTTGTAYGSIGNYRLYIQDRTDDMVVISGSIDSPTEEDWYSFPIQQQEYIALDLDAANNGSALRARIDFADTAGVIIASSTAGPAKGGLDAGGFDPDPILTYSGPNANTAMYPTVAGTYYVRVASVDGSTGPYRLYISRGSPYGYKTNEWGTNDTYSGANIITVAGGTAGNANGVSTIVSGVLRMAAGNYDEDWYRMYIDMPPSGQYVGLQFDIDTKQYVDGGWKFKSGNLRLAIYDSSGTAIVSDVNSYQMDCSSGQYGQLDPRIFWVPRSDFLDGNYYVRVFPDASSTSGAAVTPSDTFYDLKITRVYEGVLRSTYGYLNEIEQNRYFNIAQDLTFGTEKSFVIRDPGGTVDHVLGGLALLGSIASPSAAVDPFPLGDLDIYRFPAVQGQELKIQVAPYTNVSPANPTYYQDFVLKLYDSNGVLLAQSDNDNFGQFSVTGTSVTQVRDYWPSITAVMPRSGTYYVEVSGAQPMTAVGGWPASTGTYALVVTKQGVVVNETTYILDPLPGPAASVATALNLYRGEPQTIAGTISSPGELDKYTFAVTAGTAVCFQLSDRNASGLEGRLQLWDAGGNLLLESPMWGTQGFGTSNAPLLTYNFPATGLYQIVVSSNPGGIVRTGDYLLAMTLNPANITSRITIGGDLNGTVGSGLGLITAPGSLTGSISIGGDVVGRGRIELGQDLAGPISMRNLGVATTLGGGQTGNITGSIFVGGTIRSSGSISLTNSVRDTGSIFTRGAQGGPGPNNAPLRVSGQISPKAELVVAPPGGYTGRGNVYITNSVLDSSYQPVRLYNLDASGTLTGMFASVTRYGGTIPDFGDRRAYAPNRDFVAAGYTPNMGSGQGTQGVQVQMYYEMDRYHSYMTLLGYGSYLNRVIYADENERYDNPYGFATGTFTDVDYAPSVWGYRLPTYNGQAYGAMGDLLLQAYNRGVNEGLIQNYGFLSTALASAGNESQAIEYGLADYRAASINGVPWIGKARTDFTDEATRYNLGYLRIVDNVLRWNTQLYGPWGGNATRLGSRVLSGILWDIRSVVGQYVADTLSMSSLIFLNQASRAAFGTPLIGNIGFVSSTTPNMLDALIAADQQLYNGAHITDIRQAFAAHNVGTYDFTTKSDAPAGTDYVLVQQPAAALTVYEARTPNKGSTANWTVQFDDILTKLEYGEVIEVLKVDASDATVLVASYTPPLDPFNLASDFGRGWQNYVVAVNDAKQVIIRLTTDADTEFSLGFRAFVTDPPGPVTGSGWIPPGTTFYADGTPPFAFQSLTAGAGSTVPAYSVSADPTPPTTDSPSLALLQSLVGTISGGEDSPASGTTTGGTVLTVNDIARASEPVSRPPAAPVSVGSVLVFGDIGEATQSELVGESPSPLGEVLNLKAPGTL